MGKKGWWTLKLSYLTLIRESWKKIQSAAVHYLYMFLCFGFFSGKRARWRSQKMAYIFVQHGIFPHILAYAIWNWHHKIALLTLYLHILYLFSKTQLWRHQRWFWIFVPENALGHGPKNSPIRVKSLAFDTYVLHSVTPISHLSVQALEKQSKTFGDGCMNVWHVPWLKSKGKSPIRVILQFFIMLS